MSQAGLKYYLKNPRQTYAFFSSIGLLNWMPDSMYLKLAFRMNMRKKLDLKNPKTFNEKLQWLKLYDRKPEYTDMVDKYEAKKYVARIIGEEYVIPTFGVWDKFDDIDFDELPDRFVLKCTHDSGGLVICRDKAKLDIEAVKKKIEKSLRRKYYYSGREWPYKNVKPRIIAEEFLSDNLQDYRIYCFNGEPKLIYSYTNVSNIEGTKPEPAYCDIYDCDWHELPVRQKSPPKGNIPRPANLDKMISCAKLLSKEVPLLRVDFYDCGKMLIGELTFSPGGGMSTFHPSNWDDELGNWIKLPGGGVPNNK